MQDLPLYIVSLVSRSVTYRMQVPRVRLSKGRVVTDEVLLPSGVPVPELTLPELPPVLTPEEFPTLAISALGAPFNL